jgi:glutamate/tyrosine decarboxylase-like PLP-dependent enzyme
VEFGPELSRGNRAFKVWSQLAGFGTRHLGERIEENCLQAEYLGRLVTAEPAFELMAPVSLNICCFRHIRPDMDDPALDALNEEIVILLQESGVAAPSTTRIRGRTAIRVNLTNHRTQRSDLDLLLTEIRRIAQTAAPAPPG